MNPQTLKTRLQRLENTQPEPGEALQLVDVIGLPPDEASIRIDAQRAAIGPGKVLLILDA